MYTKHLAEEIVSITWAYGKIQSAIGACERVFELMDYNPIISCTGGKKLE